MGFPVLSWYWFKNCRCREIPGTSTKVGWKGLVLKRRRRVYLKVVLEELGEDEGDTVGFHVGAEMSSEGPVILQFEPLTAGKVTTSLAGSSHLHWKKNGILRTARRVVEGPKISIKPRTNPPFLQFPWKRLVQSISNGYSSAKLSSTGPGSFQPSETRREIESVKSVGKVP